MSVDDLTLFELGPFVATPAVGTIGERFATFHAANPWVYEALVQLARQTNRGGLHPLGIGMLFEVLRWQWMRSTLGDDFKLNNDYRSRYARLIMDSEPDLADVFETRTLHTP